MRYRWGIVTIAMVASACAQQPQRTAISTPSSERLRLERRGAQLGPAAAGFLGGLVALRALGIGKPVMHDEPDDLHRHGNRFRNLGRTDASIVSLHTRTPRVEAPQPPATSPLVVKLPADLQ